MSSDFTSSGFISITDPEFLLSQRQHCAADGCSYLISRTRHTMQRLKARTRMQTSIAAMISTGRELTNAGSALQHNQVHGAHACASHSIRISPRTLQSRTGRINMLTCYQARVSVGPVEIHTTSVNATLAVSYTQRSTALLGHMLQVRLHPKEAGTCQHHTAHSRRMEHVLGCNASESSSGDLPAEHGMSAFMSGLQRYSGFVMLTIHPGCP